MKRQFVSLVVKFASEANFDTKTRVSDMAADLLTDFGSGCERSYGGAGIDNAPHGGSTHWMTVRPDYPQSKKIKNLGIRDILDHVASGLEEAGYDVTQTHSSKTLDLGWNDLKKDEPGWSFVVEVAF